MFSPDISKIDTAAVFILYLTAVGDIDKVALEADLDPRVVEYIAQKFDWISKIKNLSILSKSGKAGDYTKACNRALNFAQSNLFRSLIQRVLKSLADKDGDGLLASMATTKAGQVTISAKLMSDLSAAMEKCQHLSYLALGDESAGREAGATKVEDDLSIETLHASVTTALSHPATAGTELKLIESSIEELVKNTIPKKPL